MKWFVFIFLVFMGADQAFSQDECVEVGQNFEKLISEKICNFNKCNPMSNCTNCLEPIVFNACASGCPRYGYNINIKEVKLDDSQWNPRIGIHGSFAPYLKKLRNAATACPNQSITIPFHAGENLNMTLGNLLWHQTEMMLRSGQTRFYSKRRKPLSLAQVKRDGKNTIDPRKFHYVTWVTEGGKAHAMTQADIGMWFLTTAWNWAKRGNNPKDSEYFLYLARAAFRTFAVPDNQGGVRNNKRSYKCFNNMYCYWFHSRSISSNTFPETVLNQHLHAVRDALSAHLVLDQWRKDIGKSPSQPLPANFLTDPFIDNLREFARGGLFQLAYARGSVTDPSAPPNLADFMDKHEYGDANRTPTIRYSAFYRYFFTGAKPGDQKNGGRNISPSKTCHYHYHSVSLLAGILKRIRENLTLWQDPHFKGIYYKLLYGRNSGNTRACKQNQLVNQNNMAGIPLAEFYRASLSDSKYTFQKNCSNDQPMKFTKGIKEFAESAPFLSHAYNNCNYQGVNMTIDRLIEFNPMPETFQRN